MRCSERVYDLLVPFNKEELRLRDTGHAVSLPKARSELIESSDDVLRLLARGNRNRAIACTNMNRTSSRGHALLLVTLRCIDRENFKSSEATLYLVDLAGSEKVAKTGADGKRLTEARYVVSVRTF